MTKQKRGLSIAARKALTGRLFILPFEIGFVIFFGYPFIKSLIFSFQELAITPQGLQGKLIGLANYHQAFFVDPNFVRELTNAIRNMFYQVPLIMVYSLFTAFLIKDRFPGRTVVRAIFFLPVVVASGVIMQILKEDVFSRGAISGQTVYLFMGGGMEGIFYQLGIPPEIVSYFTEVINRIFDLTWKSGVQILLFLAGLYTISPQLYEAARIEGATSWQTLWKVTIPMLSPIILLNLIYSIIDTFTDYTNVIIRMINNTGMKELRYGYSAAISWVYFVSVLLILGVALLLVRKKMFYVVE